MTGMIPFAGQVLDEVRYPRQRPQVGLVAALDRTCDQRGANRIQLHSREAGLPAGGAPAPQARGPLGLPYLVPVMGGLPSNTESASHFCRIDTLFEESCGLETPLFHRRVIALFAHDAVILQIFSAPVSLLYESQ